MAVDPEFLELMPNRVKWRQKVGQNTRGEETFGPDVEIRCLVVDGLVEVVDTQGKKQDATGTIYCDDVYLVEPVDEVELQSGKIAKVFRIDTFSDETGPLYTVIYTG